MRVTDTCRGALSRDIFTCVVKTIETSNPDSEVARGYLGSLQRKAKEKMANEADEAAVAEELFLKVSLANSMNRSVNSPVATGFCLNCDDAIERPKRWCDSDCRDDWQRLENAKRHASGKSLLTSEMLGE